MKTDLAGHRLGFSLGGRKISDPGSRVLRYCGAVVEGRREVWAYGFYDTIATDPRVLTPIDIVAASALHPGISRADLEFFDCVLPALNAWLDDVPESEDLACASSTRLDHVARVAEIAGPRTPLVSKVLHRKRPNLVPLIDRHLVDWYRFHLRDSKIREASSLRILLESLADDLMTNVESIDGVRDVVEQAVLQRPSPLRVLDIAIWMEGR